MSLKKVLPQLYQGLLSQSLLNLNVKETKATCDNCLRARDKRFEYTYKSNLKCCTFVPFIPNWAVGGILKENLPGESVIRRKIQENQFNLPIGLFADFKYQYEFLNKSRTDFGNREDLLCYYFDRDQNQCSIWNYRGVVCTTYYCRSDYGNSGLLFWECLKDYLSYIEMALAEDCLVMKDFSPRDLSDQLDFLNRREFNQKEKKQTQLSAEEIKKYWNGYHDPVNFYISCHDLVEKMNRKYFKEIIGEQGLNLEKKVVGSAACLLK